MKTDQKFWTERSVPGSPSWPFFQGRFLSRYRYVGQFAKGARMVDVASGTGYGSYLLATELQAREVVGVEIDEQAVQYAREHYSAPNLRFVHGDAQNLASFSLGTFDVVSSMGTLEHIKNPDLFAQQIRSALKKNGLWLVTMLNPAMNSRDPFHHQEWDAEQLRSFLLRHFHEVKVLSHAKTVSAGVKEERNRNRYSFIGGPIKRMVKSLAGPRLSWRLSLYRADTLTPEDFCWSEDIVPGALEFLGICRGPK